MREPNRVIIKFRTLALLLFFCCSQIKGQPQTQKTFPLPEIKEISYLSVPSALERIFPPNSCQENLLKLLKLYNRRLNNIRGYEVYVVKQNCAFSQNTCLCFETAAQGEFSFLILYNRKWKQATVLVASYSFLSDSEVYSMHFKIRNNEIILTDSGITEGEGGKPEEFTKNTVKVRISKSGKIQVIPN